MRLKRFEVPRRALALQLLEWQMHRHLLSQLIALCSKVKWHIDVELAPTLVRSNSLVVDGFTMY